MNPPDPPPRHNLPARFIVERHGRRAAPVTYEELSALIESEDITDAVIYRIHRVDADGRMELVGVRPAELARPDCLLLAFPEVRDARAEFDRLVAAARSAPPPCQVKLQLRRLDERDPPHVVALLFPAVCDSAVGHWLQSLGHRLEDFTDGGPEAWQDYAAAPDPIILETRLPLPQSRSRPPSEPRP